MFYYNRLICSEDNNNMFYLPWDVSMDFTSPLTRLVYSEETKNDLYFRVFGIAYFHDRKNPNDVDTYPLQLLD